VPPSASLAPEAAAASGFGCTRVGIYEDPRMELKFQWLRVWYGELPTEAAEGLGGGGKAAAMAATTGKLGSPSGPN